MSNTPCPPNLLALLSPLPDVAEGREDCPSLQEIFKHEGINNRARRMYHELGDALIEPLSSHFSRLDKTLARREVLAFLRLVQSGEMDAPPPRELVEALARLELPQPAIEKLPAYLFRAIWKECTQRLYRQEAVSEWLWDEAIPLVEWFILTAQDSHMDANRRRAGWTSFFNQWETWSQGSARPDGNRSWPHVMPRFESGPFLIQELNHEREVYAEGLAMQHCVANWVSECLTEGVHLFSIRARRSGERLATMAIAPLERSGWKIIQLKGPKNVDVSPLINEIAAIFEGFLNASASPYCI